MIKLIKALKEFSKFIILYSDLYKHQR